MKKKSGSVIPPERRSPRLTKSVPEKIPSIVDLTEHSTESVEDPIPVHIEQTLPSVKEINHFQLGRIREVLLEGLGGKNITLKKLSNIFFDFHTTAPQGEKMILPLLLSGTSGTGKTTAMERIKKLYGINEKSENFIYEDLSQITTKTDITKFLGAAPSYYGYGDRSFVDKLLDAIGDKGVTTKKITTTKKTTTNTRKRTKVTTTPNKSEPPSVLLIHLEEVDKADSSFLTTLINFLETGRLTSGNRKEFLLPDQTRMIVVLTANYGKDEIPQLSPLTDYHKARLAIIEHMELSGVEKPIIGRFPHILPFFVLEKEVVQKTTTESISLLFELVEFQYRDYFTKFSFRTESFQELEKALFIYAKRADPELGMRDLKAVLRELKRELCCETLVYITDFLSKEVLPLKEAPLLEVLSLTSITDYDSLLERCGTNTTTYHLIKEAQESSSLVELVLVIVTYKEKIMTSVVIQSEKRVSERALVVVKDRRYCDSCGHYCLNMTRIRIPEIVQTKIRMIFKNYCNLCISLQQQQQLMY